ncbi:MAG: GHMP family kinase ATP-binding protein [bacterium JZ-2024 1]
MAGKGKFFALRYRVQAGRMKEVEKMGGFRIKVSAPTRVDLAGGTLDIPPLYLFHQPAYTINVAIELRAQVSLTTGERGILLVSKDRKKEVRAPSLGHLDIRKNRDLALLIYAMKNYGREGMHLETEIEAPTGAGMGGSSALAIGIIAALALAQSGNLPPEEITMRRARGVETQTLGVPTGYQDYYSAYYGGLNILQFKPEGVERETVNSPDFLQQLQDFLVLVYTGKPHFSGANNWVLFRQHIEGEKRTIRFFERLKENALGMRESVVKKDIGQVGYWMRRDWDTRRKMLPEMSTEKIDLLVRKAREIGSIGERVCGAGGGGVLALLCPPEKQEKLRKEILRLKGILLPCRLARQGLLYSRE